MLWQLRRASRPHIQNAGCQPAAQFMQHDAGQESGVIEDDCGLAIMGQQPADFENMLVHPLFAAAKDDEQQEKKSGERQ